MRYILRVARGARTPCLRLLPPLRAAGFLPERRAPRTAGATSAAASRRRRRRRPARTVPRCLRDAASPVRRRLRVAGGWWPRPRRRCGRRWGSPGRGGSRPGGRWCRRRGSRLAGRRRGRAGRCRSAARSATASPARRVRGTWAFAGSRTSALTAANSGRSRSPGAGPAWARTRPAAPAHRRQGEPADPRRAQQVGLQETAGLLVAHVLDGTRLRDTGVVNHRPRAAAGQLPDPGHRLLAGARIGDVQQHRTDCRSHRKATGPAAPGRRVPHRAAPPRPGARVPPRADGAGGGHRATWSGHVGWCQAVRTTRPPSRRCSLVQVRQHLAVRGGAAAAGVRVTDVVPGCVGPVVVGTAGVAVRRRRLWARRWVVEEIVTPLHLPSHRGRPTRPSPERRTRAAARHRRTARTSRPSPRPLSRTGRAGNRPPAAG